MFTYYFDILRSFFTRYGSSFFNIIKNFVRRQISVTFQNLKNDSRSYLSQKKKIKIFEDEVF